MSHSNKSNNTVAKDSQSMTAMLISISILFFITKTPAVFTSILRNSLRNQQRSVEYIMRFNVVDSVCRLLRWLNNVLNFFCYCISGTRFREELMLMLKDVKCCKYILPSKNDLSKSETTVSTISVWIKFGLNFLKHFWTQVLYWTTDIPVLDFRWGLFWVLKPEWTTLFALGGGLR